MSISNTIDEQRDVLDIPKETNLVAYALPPARVPVWISIIGPPLSPEMDKRKVNGLSKKRNRQEGFRKQYVFTNLDMHPFLRLVAMIRKWLLEEHVNNVDQTFIITRNKQKKGNHGSCGTYLQLQHRTPWLVHMPRNTVPRILHQTFLEFGLPGVDWTHSHMAV